jgi:hypothetical protein
MQGNKKEGEKRGENEQPGRVGLIWGAWKCDQGLLLIPPRPLDLVNPINILCRFPKDLLCPSVLHVEPLLLFSF